MHKAEIIFDLIDSNPPVQRCGVRFGQRVVWVALSHQPDFESCQEFCHNLAQAWNNSEFVTPIKMRRSGLPLTPQAAIALGVNGGVPPEFCEMIFHQCEARSWFDGAGQPIANFRSFLTYQWARQGTDWRARKSGHPTTVTPSSPWEIQQRLEAINKALRELNDSNTTLAGGKLNYGKYRDDQGELLPKYKSYRLDLRSEQQRLKQAMLGVAAPE